MIVSNTNKVSCANKEEIYMATSSITKNFVISGKRQVELFADAIEASANNRPTSIPVSAKMIKGEEELREFMEKRGKAYSKNR